MSLDDEGKPNLSDTPLRLNELNPDEEFGDDCDYVLSRDEHDPNGPLELKRVLKKFIRVSPVLNLHIGGKIIGTTGEHPFYVLEKGWLPAGALQIGDLLQMPDGNWLAVEGVADSGQVETVYNLEVEGYHTYFVGSNEWGWSVWAHNASYERYVSAKEVRMYDICNQKFTILTDEGIKFGKLGSVKPEKLSRNASDRALKYGYKFEVELEDAVVKRLRDAGVAEASGHRGSLDIRTSEQLEILNEGLASVRVINVANGKEVTGFNFS